VVVYGSAYCVCFLCALFDVVWRAAEKAVREQEGCYRLSSYTMHM
jgi:hypothetical protein